MPVEGLSLTDEGLTYNGVPFSQASQGERLRVAVGMALAMLPEPEEGVRVILVRDGSLLDAANLKEVCDMVDDADSSGPGAGKPDWWEKKNPGK